MTPPSLPYPQPGADTDAQSSPPSRGGDLPGGRSGRRWHRGWRERRSGPGGVLAFGDVVGEWLAARSREPRRQHLDQLWKNWEMVMGPDLAPLAHPLGHRDGLLLVGAEDHLLLQELTYAVPEILERVNAFMDENFFHKVELRLLSEKTPLNRARPAAAPLPPPPPRPARLGELRLDPESPVGRCYAAYLRCFEDRRS